MLRIGLTGNIATGKSTVSAILKEAGVPVVSSDELVRSFQSPGNILWQEIRQRWGEKYMDENNELDRDKMARDLLDDRKFRVCLEEISHPLVRQEINKIFSVWEQDGRDLGVAEVPLLFEAGWVQMFDRIILTWVSEDIQVERIMSKRSIDEKTARKWLSIQVSQDIKKEKADFVVDTAKPVEETKKDIEVIVSKLKQEEESNELSATAGENGKGTQGGS